MRITPGVVIKDGTRMFGGEGPSFSLSSSDFTTINAGYGLEGDNTGFSIGGSYSVGGPFYAPQLQVVNGGRLAKAQELIAFWSNNGLTYSDASYMFNVSWGPGSSTNTAHNVALITFNNYGDPNSTSLTLGVVDTNVTGWDTPGQNPFSIAAANGSFYLPATFTLIQPTIQDINSWC